jgi:glycosyltransferase involved in cell wall biosynthesis
VPANISVLIPAFYRNRDTERQLRDALSSISTQSLQPLEIVVSDDSSPEGFERITKVIEVFDLLGVRHVVNPGKNGISRNTNFAMSQSTSQFIHILHQDDTLVDSNTYENVIDGLLNSGAKWAVLGCEHSGVRDSSKWRFEALLGLNEIGGPSSIVLSSEINIRFDEDLELFNDVDFIYRLHKRFGKPYFLPGQNILYGSGPYQAQKNLASDKVSREYQLLFQKYGADLYRSLICLLVRKGYVDLKMSALNNLIPDSRIKPALKFAKWIVAFCAKLANASKRIQVLFESKC